MEDQNSKKPFVIPKTHTLNKDVLINEKTDSRNFIDLFNDIKTCALEAQFDFRLNECKSCDTIRNQRLQKLYNEKRIKMKKDQDIIERLAFHLITYRDVAINIATNGLSSDQLTFPIDKYLGNPTDGVHLCRRPDVLLASSGSQGLYRFGLLVCKILVGKGYPTIPSITNKQLPAQLHHDHHFCKIQSINKAQQPIDDLLANSLIFCYEHENFETISHPSQILPIAILWYDLNDRFSSELIPILKYQSQHRNRKHTNEGKLITKKPINISEQNESSFSDKSSITNSTIFEDSPQETSTTKYPSHFMIPYNRVYSTPNVISSLNIDTTLQQQTVSTQSIIHSRDPRLLRTKREIISNSSEAIPLSPQHLLNERSSTSFDELTITNKPLEIVSDELVLFTKSTTMIYIPLNSSVSMIDPRLKTLKQTRTIVYLELKTVKHAIQQQKRLNHYYDPKSSLPPKTSYTLIPFLIHEVSIDEYERLMNDDQNTYKIIKHSNEIDYSTLHISVVDCLNFGLIKNIKPNQICIDLEENENQIAFQQIEIFNQLIQRERQLNSQQIRLRLRENRQQRIQQQINRRKIYEKRHINSSSMINSSLPNSKIYVTTGRQLLKEHQVSTMNPNTHLPLELVDFFAREYQNENRWCVKHLLAQIIGILIEKYQIKQQDNETNHNSIKESITNDEIMNVVVDMDLDSPLVEELHDHDERFQESTLLISSNRPSESSFVSSIELKNNFNDSDYQIRCQNVVEQLKEYQLKHFPSIDTLSTMKSESINPTDEIILKTCFEQLESISSESSPMNENSSSIIDEKNQSINQINSDRSRDEFVELLKKEVFIKKSNPNNHSYDQHNRKNSFKYSNSYRRYTRPLNKKSQLKISSSRKKLSSNRTVLLTQQLNSPNDNQQLTDITIDNQHNSRDQPKSKRLKTDSFILSSSYNVDNSDNINEISSKQSSIKSVVNIPVNNEHHDCRYDLNEKRRIDISNRKSSYTHSDSNSRRDYYSKECQRSSKINSRISSQIKTYTRSSSNDSSQSIRNNYYHSKSNRNKFLNESSMYHQQQQIQHKRFNYNHQSVIDHPRFSHNEILSSPRSTEDFDYLSSSSSSHYRNNTSTMSIEDRNLIHYSTSHSTRTYK